MRLTPLMRREFLACLLPLVLLALSSAGCSSSGTADGVGRVGIDGGLVESRDGALAGTAVRIPAGALSEPFLQAVSALPPAVGPVPVAGPDHHSGEQAPSGAGLSGRARRGERTTQQP